MNHVQAQRADHGTRSGGALAVITLLSVLALFSNTALAQDASKPAAGAAPSSAEWKLTWSDEFDGPNGSTPDASKWVMETGGHGWGNAELQCYTQRADNARIHDGKLVITAKEEDISCKDGVSRKYTSARIKTAGKFSQTYGRFEARLKVPVTQGLWPAFWLLGDNIKEVGWPASGEIDIMEYVGSAPTKVLGTLHGPGYSGDKGLSTTYTSPDGSRYNDDFHVFATEWEKDAIRFYVDGKLIATRTPADLPAGGRWVFDHPFFIILNLAVGGHLPGNPDATTVLPQQYVVDYVRVYAR